MFYCGQFEFIFMQDKTVAIFTSLELGRFLLEGAIMLSKLKVVISQVFCSQVEFYYSHV